MDNFPTDAVYGPGCNASSLSGWDGRDRYQDVVVHVNETRDDDTLGNDYGCDDGVEGGSIEVMHSLNVAGQTAKNAVFSLLSTSWSCSPAAIEGSESHDGPRMEYHSPLSSGGLASPNSLMMDLSDLEHSLNDEVSTVKDWLRRVKTERDKLRRDKTRMTQELMAERQMRDGEVSRLQAAIAVTMAKADHEKEHLWSEIKCLKDQLGENEAVKQKEAASAMTEMRNLQRLVDSANADVKSMEEALMKEKGASTIREMNKIEEIRKLHFTQMGQAISELETKFEKDLRDMTVRKAAMLKEEVEAHANTTRQLEIMSSEKEHVTKEWSHKVSELDELISQYKKKARIMDEKNSFANDEIKSLREELHSSKISHDTIVEEVQTITTENEDLQLQLAVNKAELMSLQKQFQQAKSYQLLEDNRTKEEVKKLSDLVEATSADRDMARHELSESKDRVQHLTKSNDKAQQEINQLKDEVQRQVIEIETLNEARNCSVVYEEKSKIEINRLRHKLDETTGDILRSIQNSTPYSQNGSSTDLHNDNNVLVLPSLVDDVNIPSAEKVIGKDVQDENGELSRLECTSLRAVIARLNRERDALRRMVDTLKPLASDGEIIQLDAMENEIEDLKTKLFQAEEAYCKIKVERDILLLSEAKKIGNLDSSLDAKAKEKCEANSKVEVDGDALVCERIADLESLLDAKVKENELLSAELNTMRANTTGNANYELESLLDVKEKTNERLRSELDELRDKAIDTDTGAAMQMSKEIEELKQEHRVEVKLLKQEHAEIKTSIKLLQKEKDEIASAYEQEKLSNVDLESSLQDLVTLFEQERAMHEEKIQAHKLVKKKYNSMRKKRVPIDAAYKACCLTLDRLESSKSQEHRSQSAQDATKLIELLDILNHELDGQSGSRLSSPSTYECFSSDRNLVEELVFRGKCIELKVLEMKVKVKMDHLSTLPKQSIDSELSSPESYEALHAAHQALQEKSRNLTKELVDSTKAFEETISSYESVISKMNGLLSAKKDENTILKSELAKAKSMVHYKSDITNMMEAHHEELNAYREAVDVLKGRLEEEANVKAKLHMEVERLKSDFTVVISQFEQELLLSNEASNKALQRIREERDTANLALSAKEEEYDHLASELEAVQEAISKLDENGSIMSQQATEYEQTIQSLQTKLAENESERQKLMTTFDQMKESKQMQVQLLQNKLDDAMASNSEEVQLYDQLRADCTSLKEEKESVIEKNAELTATIANITEENLALIAQNEMQRQSLETIEKELENARQQEIQKVDSSRHELEKAQSQIESLIVENKSLLVKNEEQRHQLEILRSVKLEKETLAAKNDEQKHSLEIIKAQLENIRQDVHASKESADDKIASLIEERESLKITNEKQKQSLTLIENQLANIRLKVSEADNTQKMATEKTNELEARISSLQEEIKLAETAKNEAIIAADATQVQLTKASKRIEELTVCTQTMKVDHEKKELELKNDIDSQMVCMNEVVGSLQRQIQSIELEKETNRKKYKHEIEMQQKVSLVYYCHFLCHCNFPFLHSIYNLRLQEILKLQNGQLDALQKIDSLSDVVSALKSTLASEKDNAQILLSQLKTSEEERKSYMKQKDELEAEVASRLLSESAMSERIRNLEGVETELASRIESENTKAIRITRLESELKDMLTSIRAKDDDLNNLSARMLEQTNLYNTELNMLKSKMNEESRTNEVLQERILSMETHIANLQHEFKRTLNKTEEETSKLRVVLKEAKSKIKQLHDQQQELKDNSQSLEKMLNDAVRGRASSDASLQESLQLLEQQKRIDIKRKGEISKLEQTVEILKSKERYLESYVASLKKQNRRG